MLLFRRLLRRQRENAPLSVKSVFPLRGTRGLAIGIRSVYFRLSSGNLVKHLYPCRRLTRRSLLSFPTILLNRD